MKTATQTEKQASKPVKSSKKAEQEASERRSLTAKFSALKAWTSPSFSKTPAARRERIATYNNALKSAPAWIKETFEKM